MHAYTYTQAKPYKSTAHTHPGPTHLTRLAACGRVEALSEGHEHLGNAEEVLGALQREEEEHGVGGRVRQPVVHHRDVCEVGRPVVALAGQLHAATAHAFLSHVPARNTRTREETRGCNGHGSDSVTGQGTDGVAM